MSTCEWWVLVTISAVTLILYALLLLTLYIMLSRKIASHSCSKQASSSPAAQPQPPPPTSLAAREGVQTPAYAGSRDTSSETSEDSDSSPSCPQGSHSEENLNYTSLVFAGKGCVPGSATDYENMKMGADYVNVDPKKKKTDFWPCSSPVASKSIEYTEVKL